MPLAARPSQFMDTAYKVSLYVDILDCKQIDNATHYQVRVTKNRGTEDIVFSDVYRRYSDFHKQLFVKFEGQGYKDLPSFPRKQVNLFMDGKDKKARMLELENYLRELISRKDTRNCTEMIDFLGLGRFAPETLYNQPKLHVSQQFKGRFVTHCAFVAKYSIYFLVLTDNRKKVSWIEAYAFKKTGIVSDNYMIRGSTSTRQSESMKG